MGVNRMSRPLRVTRLAARSIVKSPRLDRRLLVRREETPERSPEPREELVHPERLGDVVVGAGVQRGDLVGLGVAHRQDDDRDAAPAPNAFDHFDAADAGEAEIDDHDVGTAAGHKVERVFAGLGEVDVEPAGPEVDANRAADLSFVVDDEDTGGHDP